MALSQQLRSPDASVQDLITRFGLEAVKEELDEMIHHDMADWAMAHALKIGAEDIARSAAQVVVNSGSYGNAAKAQARTIVGPSRR